MSTIIEEKILELKNCINDEEFCNFKDCQLNEAKLQEDYYKTLISTVGLYASVHPEEYLKNKTTFYNVVLDLNKELTSLREKKLAEGEIVETSSLDDNPTNSELLANSYATALYLFCAIDTMNEGKFNFNYFKGKYPKTTLRTLPLNCFDDLDIKLTLACETDKKLYDNFVESNLKKEEKVFVVETLDSLNIRGPELRMVVRAVCANNFKKVLALCKLLTNNYEFSEELLNTFIENINCKQTSHTTFKAQKLSKIDNHIFLDITRPFITKLDENKENEQLLLFSDYLNKLKDTDLEKLNFLKPFLDENNKPQKLNEDEISDFDIRAIFTNSELVNLENLLKDTTQFNLYLSRICLELRNYSPTSVTPIILYKLNLGEKGQKETAKRKDRIYCLKDADICVLDYIEANNFNAFTKYFLTKAVLQHGKNKIETNLDNFINNNILTSKTDKLIKYTSSENEDTFFEICEILKENSSIKDEIIRSLNADNDNRTLQEIREDLQRSKIDLNTIDLMAINNQSNINNTEFNQDGENLDTENLDTENLDTENLDIKTTIFENKDFIQEESFLNDEETITLKDEKVDVTKPKEIEDNNLTSVTINKEPQEDILINKNENLNNFDGLDLTDEELALLKAVESGDSEKINESYLNAYKNNNEEKASFNFDEEKASLDYDEENTTNENNNASVEPHTNNGLYEDKNDQLLDDISPSNTQENNNNVTNETPIEALEKSNEAHKQDTFITPILNQTEADKQIEETEDKKEDELLSEEKIKDILGDENDDETDKILGSNEDFSDIIGSEKLLEEENGSDNKIETSEKLEETKNENKTISNNLDFNNSSYLIKPNTEANQANSQVNQSNNINNANQFYQNAYNPYMPMPNQNPSNMPNQMFQPAFMPYYTPYFNPYQPMPQPNMPQQNMPQQNMPLPNMQNPFNTNQQTFSNTNPALNNMHPNMNPQFAYSFPYGYPYPFYPSMNPMANNSFPQNKQSSFQTQQQKPTQASNQAKKPEVKPKPAPQQYVSRAQKLEDAFFKDMETTSKTPQEDLITKTETEAPNLNKENIILPKQENEISSKDTTKTQNLTGEKVTLSEEDFFADMNSSTLNNSNTDPDTDPDTV